MSWTESFLAPHPKASPIKEKRGRAALLLDLREKLSSLFRTAEVRPVPLSTSPHLPKPLDPPLSTFRPLHYFFRGVLDADRRKNPTPILYLLTETNERAIAKPVPGNSVLLRSLCKGKGSLKQNKQGLVYLDVDDRFVSMLLPYLELYGLVKPPYFNLFALPDGAHVPVIPAREVAFQHLDQVEQIGREYSFEIEGLYSMEPTSWPEMEQVWFFRLHSPELEQLRRRLFLPSLPGGHPFHIAVAVKPRRIGNEMEFPFPFMRINTGFTAA